MTKVVHHAISSMVNKINSALTLEGKQENAVPKENLSADYEIECLRCHDLMTLRSEFDRFFYFCEECCFSLSFTQ
jgi:formamidopyrimidine-DNA glycosylase